MVPQNRRTCLPSTIQYHAKISELVQVPETVQPCQHCILLKFHFRSRVFQPGQSTALMWLHFFWYPGQLIQLAWVSQWGAGLCLRDILFVPQCALFSSLPGWVLWQSFNNCLSNQKFSIVFFPWLVQRNCFLWAAAVFQSARQTKQAKLYHPFRPFPSRNHWYC